MAFSVTGLVTAMTVRSRIIVLAIIPLIGFLANGTAFTTGQAEVGEAFNSAKHANELAETSQDLKNSLGSMRILVRDFATHPSPELMQTFDDLHRAAMNNVARIETDVAAVMRQVVEGLRRRIGALSERFAHLA